MKRLSVWVDCEEADVADAKKKLEAFLRAQKMAFTILPEREVSYSSKDKK